MNAVTLLPPNIIEAVLDGQQPAEMRLEDLLDRFPVEWEGSSDRWRSTIGQFARTNWARPDVASQPRPCENSIFAQPLENFILIGTS